MDLIEDHQRALVQRARPVQRRVRGHLRIGHRYPGEVSRGPALRVAVGRVQRDAEAVGRLRPLVLQVLRRRDHGDRGDLAAAQQLGRDGQGVGGLPRSGRGDQQEVAPGQPEVLLVGVLLPAPQGQKKIRPDGTFAAAAVAIGRCRGSTHKAERLPAVAPVPRISHRAMCQPIGAAVARTVKGDQPYAEAIEQHPVRGWPQPPKQLVQFQIWFHVEPSLVLRQMMVSGHQEL